MIYGYCIFHELECDYDGQCVKCPYNTKEDVEWFKHLDDMEGTTRQEMSRRKGAMNDTC